MSRTFILICLLILLPCLAGASVVRVPSDQASLQLAYLFASQGDTILVAPGTYSGSLNRDMDFAGKEICLISENGSAETILDFDASVSDPHQGLRIREIETGRFLLKGFTFRNAYKNGRFDTAGALYFEGDSLEIVDCAFETNHARTAGAAFVRASWLKIDSCVFSNNSNGAIIAEVESIECSGSTFLPNDGVSFEGISVGLAAFSDCRFEASDTCALSIVADSVLFVGTSFENNWQAAHVSARQIVVNNCLFTSNHTQSTEFMADTILMLGTTLSENLSSLSLSARLVRVDSCDFLSCTGDALTVSADSTTITGSTFEDNNTAISAEANWILTDGCQFVANSPDSGDLLDLVSPRIELDGCFFESNTMSAGSILNLFSPTVSVDSCTLIGNIGQPSCFRVSGSSSLNIASCSFENNSGVAGGVLRADSLSMIMSDGCTFIGNRADSGGVFFAAGESEIVLTDCGFSDNRAEMGGVLCSNDEARAALVGCNLFRNEADSGGVLYATDGASGVEFRNCLIAFGAGGGVMAGSPPILSCCVLFQNWGGDWTENIADQLGVNGNSDANPLICDYALGDYRIDAQSPCAPANNSCGEQIGRYDVGCDHRSHGEWYVDAEGTGDAISIQDAIDRSGWADTIVLAAGVYGGLGNRDVDFRGKNIVLRSESGPGVTIIDCAGSASHPHRAFSIHSGSSSASRIEGITVRNGFYYQYGNGTGGAVDVVDASPSFVNCTFEDCLSSRGGALRLERSMSSFVDCRFFDNRSRWGGAVAVYESEVDFENCVFERNLAMSEDSLFNYTASGPTCDEESKRTVHDDVMFRPGLGAPIGIESNQGWRLGKYLGESDAISTGSDGSGWAERAEDLMSSEHMASNRAGGEPVSEIRIGSSSVSSEPPELACNNELAGDTLYYQREGGGAVHAQLSSVTFEHSQFIENRAWKWGAGIHCYDNSSLRITDCDIIANRCGNFGHGAGIAVVMHSTADIRSSTFELNYESSRGGGIVIYESCQAALHDCGFWGNQARAAGGGIEIYNDCDVDITECTVIDNGAYWGSRGGQGGGIDILRSRVTIADTRISRNRTHESSGAGVRVNGGTVAIRSCVIVQNVASSRINPSVGGGISLYGCHAELDSCTISDNSASYGGNISLDGPNPRQCVLRNCIVSFAGAGWGIYVFEDASDITIESCNVYGNLRYDGPVELADQLQANGNVSVHPLFCDRYGGDYSLGVESACLPENNSSGIAFGALGVGCKMDPETWHVKPDGSGDAPTIQAAIDSARHCDTIWLAEGTYTGEGNYDIDYRGRLVKIISEAGPDKTIIDCQSSPANPRRGFLFEHIEDLRAVLRGVTIANGYTTNGGGIFCDYYSSPLIEDCVITGNTVTDLGGGVAIQRSTPRFENCIVSANSAYQGGGFYLNMYGNISVRSCTIVSNVASPFFGGHGDAIFCYASAPWIDQSIIANGSPFNEAIFCEMTGAPEITYTNIFGFGQGDWVSCIDSLEGVHGNMSVDPLFCDTLEGNYRLLPESPCAPSNNPSAVLIGARGVGCDPTDVDETDSTNALTLPTEFALSQNYPNPFNPGTTIHFSLPERSHVEITVHNILGQWVTTLIDDERPAGEYSTVWHGTDSRGRAVSTGVYFYRIEAGDFVETKKMLLLK